MLLRQVDARLVRRHQQPRRRQRGGQDRQQHPQDRRSSASSSALGKLDKALARTIEDEMFVFENLNDLDDKGLGTLLRTVDNDVLVVALKGADERLRNRMLGCMSSRAAQSIQDEIAERGPMRLAEVQDAQKEMLAIARRLGRCRHDHARRQGRRLCLSLWNRAERRRRRADLRAFAQARGAAVHPLVARCPAAVHELTRMLRRRAGAVDRSGADRGRGLRARVRARGAATARDGGRRRARAR